MSIEVGDIVRFRAMRDPLNGDETEITVEGKVIRGPWGRTAANVTIRTLEEPSRLFARLASNVEVIRRAVQ